MLYIIDTYAWAEYFIGSKKGEKVRKVIHSPENMMITPECCLAELKGWCLREGKDFEKALEIIKANSEVQAITKDDWLNAAELRHKIRKEKGISDFGLVDALILAKQKKNNCAVLSGDEHFKGLTNVEYLE